MRERDGERKDREREGVRESESDIERKREKERAEEGNDLSNCNFFARIFYVGRYICICSIDV